MRLLFIIILFLVTNLSFGQALSFATVKSIIGKDFEQTNKIIQSLGYKFFDADDDRYVWKDNTNHKVFITKQKADKPCKMILEIYYYGAEKFVKINEELNHEKSVIEYKDCKYNYNNRTNPLKKEGSKEYMLIIYDI